MKPICHPCSRFFRPAQNGFPFIEGMPVVPGTPPGLSHNHQWTDYKLWVGDLWKCEGCGTTIIVGTGFAPVSEHYLPNFKSQKAQLGATFRVNDC